MRSDPPHLPWQVWCGALHLFMHLRNMWGRKLNERVGHMGSGASAGGMRDGRHARKRRTSGATTEAVRLSASVSACPDPKPFVDSFKGTKRTGHL